MSQNNQTQHIIIPVWGAQIPSKALEAASVLSNGFEKELLVCSMKSQQVDNSDPNILIKKAQLKGSFQKRLDAFVEENDGVIVVFSDEDGIPLRQKLTMCRNLRVPYLFVQENGASLIQIEKILIPVGFLLEEKEKGPLANTFGKVFGSEITLLQPNDKGSKARQNVFFLQRLLNGYKQEYQLLQGSKSSFNIEKEAIRLADNERFNLVFIMASREYGLDDLFFGPKEYHVLKRAKVPVLLLNPRDDIYLLCGS